MRGAAKQGMKTIYIPRPHDDVGIQDNIKAKADGGDVDVVIRSFTDLEAIFGA